MGHANIIWMDDGEHWSLGDSHYASWLGTWAETGRERVLLENLVGRGFGAVHNCARVFEQFGSGLDWVIGR